MTTETRPRGLIGVHQLPNLLCVLRVVLGFTGLWFLGRVHQETGEWSGAWIVVISAAGLTDQLDGFLAKRYGWSTRLGALLDQISDKLLSLALFCFIGLLGVFPLWGVGLVVLRELFVTCLRIAANLERISIPTSQAGRFKTYSQQVAVLLIFCDTAWPTGGLAGESVAQTVLLGGWLVFWAVMVGLGKRGFAKLKRIYTVVRKDPRTGEETPSSADLVFVYLTIAAMALPLPWGGAVVALTITLGTGWTYLAAYLWARGVSDRPKAGGLRNVALALLASALLAGGLTAALTTWPEFTPMWGAIGVLSVLWSGLLTASYVTGERARALQAAAAADSPDQAGTSATASR